MSLVDERIVKMVFDNSQFDSKINSTIGSIDKLNQATEDVGKKSGGLSVLRNAFEQTEITATKAGFHIQDVWLKMASIFEYQIAGKIVNTAKKVANALTMEGISDGFKEYELKMGSIQTIMAGTGESLATVNRQLEELNKYSDQTIYSFADMTNNIGKFTNAGVKLEDAVAAIKGIANEAALSGANANEASRAMYNFSQALSAGYVKLIDWKSIENANMATKGFKETLLEVATSIGTVEKSADGMYKVLTQNANGGSMDDLISGTKNFNDSLAYQWMTTEVLTKALKIYATDVRDLSAAEKEAYEAELKAMNLTDEQIKNFEELGSKATDAASEIKTFSMLMDTLKEAIGSGWAMTWQYIIGDFEQAKALWTEVGKVVGGAIDDMSDARNRFIRGGIQTGWEEFTTMAGKSIPESEKYRDTLLAVAVSHKVLTEAEADEITSTEKLVESMHKGWVTGNMLKESVNEYYHQLANLTEEEKKEMGVTEADIKELGKLNEELMSGALSAETFANHMTRLGGRENVIEGLRYVFESLVMVINPIKNAFREIFPATTSQQLYDLTKRFHDFAQSIKVALSIVDGEGKNGTIDKITRTFKGLFSILDIGVRFVKAFIDAILPAKKYIGDFGDILLDGAAKLGDFFTKLDEHIKKANVFENFFANLKTNIAAFVDSVKTNGIVQTLKEMFGSIGEFEPKLDGFGDKFKGIIETLKSGLETLKERLAFLLPLGEGLLKVFSGLGNVLAIALNEIGDSLSGFSEDSGLGLQNLLNMGITGGVMANLFTGKGTISSITNFLNSFSETLEAFQKRISADNLMNIAKAIALLAASLFVVAMIDSDKLVSSSVAMATMIGAMTGAVAGLMGAADLFNGNAVKLKAISKVLTSMGTAMLLMAVALKLVADAADGGNLWASFWVVTLLLAELTGVTIALGKWGTKTIKGAKALKDVTSALVIMAAALAIVAKVVESGNAWEALKIISLMLLELTAVVVVLESFGKYKLSGMKSLISLAAALVIMVEALKQIADALGEGADLWEAFKILSALFGELLLVTLVLGQFGAKTVAGGMGALIAAAAILVLVQALKQINEAMQNDPNSMYMSLVVLAGALLILATALNFMTTSLPGALGLLVASAAIVVLAGALKLLGQLSPEEIIKSLLTLAGALAILAIGLTLMVAALPGALALTIAAGGLTLLAGALKILGSMSIGEIVKSLITLFAALIGLGLIATVFGTVTPLLLGFGVAIALIGVGLLAAGVGITFFASGVQALIAVLPMVITVIKMLGEAILSLIPVVVQYVMEGISKLLDGIIMNAPKFGMAVLVILETILNIIVIAIPDIAEAGVKLILALLDVIIEYIPQFAEKATELMVAFLQAISEHIPVIVDEGLKCVIALINGMADAITNNNVALLEAVDHLMDAIVQAITQWLIEFSPLGYLMDDELKKGIMDGKINVRDEIANVVQAAVDRVKEFVGDFKAAAENLIAGFIEGFKSTWAGQALQEAADFASNVVSSMNSKKGFDENSPSKKGEQSGINLIKGVLGGIEETTPKALAEAASFGNDLSTTLQNALEIAADEASDIDPVITPVLDLSNVQEGVSDISSLFANDRSISKQFAQRSISLATQINDNTNYANKLKEYERQLSDLENSNRTQKIIDAVNIAGQSNNTNVNVVLEGDAAGVFRLVRQENKKFMRSTNYIPLASQ